MPERNLSAIIIQKLGTKAASPLKKMDPIKLYLIDLFLPMESAKKPHKWDVKAIPTKEMQFRTPFLKVSNSSSHVEPGIVILTPIVSNKSAIRPRPEATTTYACTLPLPEIFEVFFQFEKENLQK